MFNYDIAEHHGVKVDCYFGLCFIKLKTVLVSQLLSYQTIISRVRQRFI